METSNTPINRKIIVMTTFRDFTGNDNDAMQILFLRGLKNQNYTNWICAITLFGEKHVEETLKREGIPHVLFNGDAAGERFSGAEFTRHGVELSDKYPGSILVWTSGDVILQKDFFQNIVDTVEKYGPLTAGTAYPCLIYRGMDDYKNKRNVEYFWTGIDTIFFDSQIFASPKAREALRTFRNDGWGSGEFYVTTFALAFAHHIINIYAKNRVTKIENDRVMAKETRAFINRTNIKNRSEVKRMAAFFDIQEKNERLWFLAYRFPGLSLHPMRFLAWFMIRFRIHFLGIRYHIRRILGQSEVWKADV